MYFPIILLDSDVFGKLQSHLYFVEQAGGRERKLGVTMKRMLIFSAQYAKKYILFKNSRQNTLKIPHSCRVFTCMRDRIYALIM